MWNLTHRVTCHNNYYAISSLNSNLICGTVCLENQAMKISSQDLTTVLLLGRASLSFAFACSNCSLPCFTGTVSTAWALIFLFCLFNSAGECNQRLLGPWKQQRCNRFESLSLIALVHSEGQACPNWVILPRILGILCLSKTRSMASHFAHDTHNTEVCEQNHTPFLRIWCLSIEMEYVRPGIEVQYVCLSNSSTLSSIC